MTWIDRKDELDTSGGWLRRHEEPPRKETVEYMAEVETISGITFFYGRVYCGVCGKLVGCGVSVNEPYEPTGRIICDTCSNIGRELLIKYAIKQGFYKL